MHLMSDLHALTDDERAIYEWQLWVEGFGEAGQLRLKNATVLVARCGGVGGTRSSPPSCRAAVRAWRAFIPKSRRRGGASSPSSVRSLAQSLHWARWK